MEFFTQLSNLGDWVVFTSVKSLPLIVAVLVIRHLFFKQFSANARQLMWLCVLVSLSIPLGWRYEYTAPDVSLGSLQPNQAIKEDSAVNIPQLNTASSASAELPDTSVDATESPKVYVTSSSHTMSFYDWLVIIWLLGICASVTLLIRSVLQFSLIKKSAIDATAKTIKTLEECRAKIGVSQAIQIGQSPYICSPLVVGLIRPYILLPEYFESKVNEEELKYVLLHEVAHIKRMDILFNWGAFAIQTLHWFNPLIWYVVKLMRRDMEAACDALVLKKISEKQRNLYGKTLINLSDLLHLPQYSGVSIGILENHKELVERIKMIKYFKPFSAITGTIFGVVLAGCAIAAISQPERYIDRASKTSVSLKKLADTVSSNTGDIFEIEEKYLNRSFQVDLGHKAMGRDEFIVLLKTHNLLVYRSKKSIRVIPRKGYYAHRELAPLSSDLNDPHPFELAYATIDLKNACADKMAPLLRVLVDRYGYFGVSNKANKAFSLFTIYSNIERLKKAIQSIDSRSEYQEDCRLKDSNFVGLTREAKR